MTEQIGFDFDGLRASIVNNEYKAGKRYEQIKPEDQIAQWLKLGLYHLAIMENNGKEPVLTGEDIRQLDLCGGTDHLDPTLSNHHKQRKVY